MNGEPCHWLPFEGMNMTNTIPNEVPTGDGNAEKPLTFTVLSATNQAPMTKVLGMNDDGTLRKSTRAVLHSGQFDVRHALDLKDLAMALESLQSHQCVTWGRPEADNGCVCAQGNTKAVEAGAIPRDREHYHWVKGPGIWMLDHDGIPHQSLTPDEFRELVVKAAPVLADAPMLWRPSASAGCVAPDGRVLTSMNRHRLYIPVKDASLIPAAGAALTSLLWSSGHGWCELSKSGQRLLRCAVDTSVWQPERIDFAAPPVLLDGIQRPHAGHRVYGNPTAEFDLQQIIDAAGQDVQIRANAMQRKARDDMAKASKEAALHWAGEHATGLASRRGITLDRATQCLIRAATKRVLMGDFELKSSNGTTVTVGELLDTPAHWHNHRFYDPLDPDEDGRVAVVNLFGTRRTLYSHRHGGVTFELRRQSARIQLAKGSRVEVTDSALQVLREREELYDFGTAAVAYVTNKGRVVVAGRDWLTDHLGRACEFYSVKVERDDAGNITQEREQPEDPPVWLSNTILAKHGERGFPWLDAVVTAPTLKLDGEVLDVPGYDPDMRLEYVPLAANTPRVPRNPTPEEGRQALGRLMEPFKTFPFADDESVGVFLAALLSACLRPSLPTCPGFGFDAPAAGSGKTLLAQCIGWLSTGDEVAVMPPARDDEEIRKRLFAGLSSGARVLLWDNLREPLGGASLDAFLTGPTFADRTLQTSSISALPNKALFLCSGNNIVLTGDTYRRVLLCRIDPQSETPYKREFACNPLKHVKANRLDMVCDALTVVRAWITAGSPRAATGNTASFEDWDRLVRQPLMWLATHTNGVMPAYADPLSGVERTASANPENAMLGALLAAWEGQFGHTPATANEAFKAAEHNSQLRDALEDIAPAKGGQISNRTLGRWLTTRIGQLVQGRKLTRQSGQGGVFRWRVDNTNANGPKITHPAPPYPPVEIHHMTTEDSSVGSVGWSGFLLAHPDIPLEVDLLH